MVKNKTQIFLNNLNYSLFKKDKFFWLFIYNKNYSICFKINGLLDLKIISNCIISLDKNYNYIYKKQLLSYIEQILKYHYVKIKFSGKGYKIKKNYSNNLNLLFNRAHITSLWWKNIILKKIKKYKIYIKYTPKNINFYKILLHIRNINIFTKRGLRESKQIILKKKGKK